jgi:hypothetical protein
MGDQQEPLPEICRRLGALTDAITSAVEAEMVAGAVNAKDVLTVLCGVIGWVISNTSPEWHSELQSYLMATVPKMVQQGRESQARFLKDKSN